ncbi:MAG: hypothetical protein IKL62_00325 [Clostridia bacterium]|nr:hypothetical protein [Clostridia bacterium]
MVKLIIGNKGSGKTKKLIDLVNTTAAESKGNVVCVEKGDTLTFSISHKVRLIDVNNYNIAGYGEYYALLCGICSGNHDVTHVFGDATLRIGTRDYNELAAFLGRVEELSKQSEAEFIFTISCDESDLPATVFEVAEKI